MIARTFVCDASRLADLLADRLPADQADALTLHLETCRSCRGQLEAMAGADREWSAARDALSDLDVGQSHRAGTPALAADGAGNDAAPGCDDLASETGWVRSLLEPCDAGGLGRLGRYPIRGVIGQGGMGVVLSGWDDELNRPLALKLLAPHLASSGAARQRFLREAQAAAAVVHPNVVPIYSIAAGARLPYLAMPFIGGGNLQQRIDRDGPLELEDCLRIALQIAEGLAAAHRQGLIHRDIKPANILLEEGGHRVLISDFGLARALDDVSMTASGVIAGTPPYMSPEQARGDTAQYRSDLFSLGSVLYAMATARPPFRGETALAVVRQIGEKPVTPIREINERMPLWLDRLADRLMRKIASERPASADHVVQLLQSCLAHVRSPATESLPAELRTSRTPRWPWAAALALGTAVTLVSLAALVWPQASSVQADQAGADAAQTPQRAAAALADPAPLLADQASLLAGPVPLPAGLTAPAAARGSQAPLAIITPDPVHLQIERIEREIQQLRSAILDDLSTFSDKETSDE